MLKPNDFQTVFAEESSLPSAPAGGLILESVYEWFLENVNQVIFLVINSNAVLRRYAFVSLAAPFAISYYIILDVYWDGEPQWVSTMKIARDLQLTIDQYTSSITISDIEGSNMKTMFIPGLNVTYVVYEYGKWLLDMDDEQTSYHQQLHDEIEWRDHGIEQLEDVNRDVLEVRNPQLIEKGLANDGQIRYDVFLGTKPVGYLYSAVEPDKWQSVTATSF